MFNEVVQHIIVGLVALAAGTTIVHRVLRFTGPEAGRTGCDSCGSSNTPCVQAAKSDRSPATVEHVAILIRRPAQGDSRSRG